MCKRIFLLAGLCSVLMVGAGCGGDKPDSYESVVKQEVKLLNETNAVLNSVQDPASADAARPRLQAAWQRYQELEQRQAQLLNVPSKERTSQSLRMTQIELKAIKKLVAAQWMRIYRAPGLDTYAEEFGDFIAALKGVPIVSDQTPVRPVILP